MSCGNLFLDMLPERTRAACLAYGQHIQLDAGHVVGHKGEPYSDVHFPTSGMIFEMEEGSDGGTAEVTMVGYEGCSGVEALLGASVHPFMRCVDMPTRAFAVPVADLRMVCERSIEFQHLMKRYVAARLRGLGISIGCYARHTVNARLARWLLRVLDRSGEADFALTHDTIALKLGVRRSSITRAIIDLAAAGAIDTMRGGLHVVARERLENLCCSCYPDARDVYVEMYGDIKHSEIS